MQLIKTLKVNKLLILILLLPIIILLPFQGILPYLDGNIQFIMSIDFFSGGLSQYLNNWQSAHPPVKFILTNFVFSTFGISAIGYSILGLSSVIMAILGTFFLANSLFGKKVALISSLLFALCPLSLSVGHFFLLDSIIIGFILISIYFFGRKKYLYYSLFATLAVLTKETAILLPISVLLSQLVYYFYQGLRRKLKIENFYPIPLLILPLIAHQIWIFIINSYGKSSWNDWNFSNTAEKGSVYTIINNLTTLNIFNDYAYQQWKHLFFLNFNWVFWFILIAGSTLLLAKVLKGNVKIKLDIQQIKVCFAIVLFFASYSLLVLTFQTYTIPRYILPLLPFLFIGLSQVLFSLLKNKNIFLKLVLSVLVVLELFSNFTSKDPVSLKIWGTDQVMSRNLYGLRKSYDGNDGITYNMQYLFIAKDRSNAILKASKEGGSVISNDCYWIFPDPNNESKMVRFLGLNTQLNCVNH